MFGSEVPVIVACSGHAVAAGALLLLGADYRVGARGEFQIGLIETQIGMVLPAVGGRVGRASGCRSRHFQQATVGARMYDPDGAADAGFLDDVVAPDALGTPPRAEAQYWAGAAPRRVPRPSADEPGRPARPARRGGRRRPGPGFDVPT